MVPARAQANPAAEAKLERAQRSYNKTSRGWDSPSRRATWWGKFSEAKRSGSERSELKFVVAIWLGFHKAYSCYC